MTRIELSDSQWEAIQKTGELPDGAREQIEAVVALYSTVQRATAAQPRAAQIRRELLRIAGLAEKLLAPFINAKAHSRGMLHGKLDEVAVYKIVSGMEPAMLATLMSPALNLGGEDGSAGAATRRRLEVRTPDTLKLLCQHLSAIERLRCWFEVAAASLPAESPGAHRAAENHLWLVGQLDAILAQHTGREGRHISRSNKDELQTFVDSCFAVVDPNVGPGSVKKAIEAYARLNPRPRRARAQITKEKRS
jgi:hypothetical protein